VKKVSNIIALESSDLTRLIGIPAIQLNKFIERRQYGVEASIRTGRGRGKRRLFGLEDLYGIALVWWLSESGLRSLVIQRILNDICRVPTGGKANQAVLEFFPSRDQVLLISRKLRTGASAAKHKRRTPQKIELLGEPDVFSTMQKNIGATTIIVWVGQLLRNLDKSLEAL
jgi:hypothetical protein